MSNNTNLTRLNFSFKDLSRTIIDKKSGIKIELGFISGLRAGYSSYQNKNSGFTISLQEQGIDQDELDKHCQELEVDAKIQNIDLLITKSDLNFDNRWYITGDLRKMFECADQDQISLPFEGFLAQEIIEIFSDYESKISASPTSSPNTDKKANEE